jgi:hypothetical protein
MLVARSSFVAYQHCRIYIPPTNKEFPGLGTCCFVIPNFVAVIDR